jgi:hypothetical protein
MARTPERHDVEIIEQPDHTLAPRTGRRTPVRTGDKVFIFPERGAKISDLEISFSGEVPFEDGKVAYGHELTVVAKHKPGGGESANVYKYSCRMTKDGRPLRSPGGGEFEVLPGEG